MATAPRVTLDVSLRRREYLGFGAARTPVWRVRRAGASMVGRSGGSDGTPGGEGVMGAARTVTSPARGEPPRTCVTARDLA